jgi:hypothetical protein
LKPSAAQIALAAILAGLAGNAGAGEAVDSRPGDLPAPETLLSNVVARAATVSTQGFRTQFTYTKLRATEELDSKGKVTEKQEKITELVPVNGRLLSKLVSENGKPATAKQRKAEEELDRRVRAEPAPEPKAGKPAPNPKREFAVTPELFDRFTFTTEGREKVNGRDAWVLAFAPRSADMPVKKFADRIVNKVAGKVWIDVEESELARAEVKLTGRVELVGGVIATMKRFDLVFEQTRFDGGAWFNTLTEANVEGRQLVVNKRVHYIEKASDFKRVAPAEPTTGAAGK